MLWNRRVNTTDVWLQLNETAWIIVNIRTNCWEKQKKKFWLAACFIVGFFYNHFFFYLSLFSIPIIVNKIIASSNHLPHLPNVWWVFNSFPLNCNIFLIPQSFYSLHSFALACCCNELVPRIVRLIKSYCILSKFETPKVKKNCEFFWGCLAI